MFPLPALNWRPMHVCYIPYTGPDVNTGIPISLSWAPVLLVSLSLALTMSYRKNGEFD